MLTSTASAMTLQWTVPYLYERHAFINECGAAMHSGYFRSPLQYRESRAKIVQTMMEISHPN